MKSLALLGLFVFAFQASGDPVPVRHTLGFLHGYVVLKSANGRILASGEATQIPSGNHITNTLTLHFKDGSLYEETAVLSQQKTFQLLTYKQVMKGPTFKEPQTLSFDTSSGKVNVEYTDKDGKAKNIDDQLSLPPDLANGLLNTLLCNIDPKVETTLSMVATTPKPRIVKLKISAAGQDAFSIGGRGHKATHYIVKIDIGGVTGVVAKVVGKQPPPVDIWVAAGDAPVFVRSRGPMYNEGPVWQVELGSPTWPKSTRTR